MMKRALFLACIAGIACAQPETPANNRDTMSQRQRDSVLGQSQLPGAQGVTRALGAADSARARNAQLDSIRP